MTTSNTRFLNFKADDFFLVCVLANIIAFASEQVGWFLDKRFYNFSLFKVVSFSRNMLFVKKEKDIFLIGQQRFKRWAFTLLFQFFRAVATYFSLLKM
jgi:hypothetical protein